MTVEDGSQPFIPWLGNTEQNIINSNALDKTAKGNEFDTIRVYIDQGAPTEGIISMNNGIKFSQ